MDPRSVLDQIRQRAESATVGPWIQRNRSDDVVGNSSVLFDDRFGVRDVPWDDAEFIAASRSDVPRLVAALTAALDLHRPETDDDAPDGWPYCTACGVDVYEEPIPWPCETVRAITDALTPKENDS